MSPTPDGARLELDRALALVAHELAARAYFDELARIERSDAMWDAYLAVERERREREGQQREADEQVRRAWQEFWARAEATA